MLLSVVMAVYNAEEYLQEAVESVLNQTYKDFEFIIVNDASTDNSAQILQNITDDRVSIIHMPRNSGGSAALKKGIEQAKGNWIAIHDADDISAPNRFSIQMDYIGKNPGIVGVGALVKCFSNDQSINSDLLKKDSEVNIRLDKDHIHEYRYWGNAFCHGSMILSKEVYQMAGGYNPYYKIAYDYDLWLRMQEYGHLVKVPEILYYWRILPNSLSRRNRDETNKEVWHTTLKHILLHRFKNLNGKPQIAVLGKKDYLYQFRVWSLVNGYYNLQFIRNDQKSNIKEAYKLFGKRKIDAIILLGDEYSMKILDYLQDMGLELNKNVFIIS